MTARKQVAKSLLDVTGTYEYDIISQKDCNRNELEWVITRALTWWEMDLYTRNPAPAMVENGKPTDLDLATFLYSLAGRGAVVSIPTYETLRKSTVKEGQSLSSRENRHGAITGVVANKDTFVFSLRIKDMNVYTTDSVGEHRNFALTDFNGDWYKGWRRVNFIPTAKENDFLSSHSLWSQNSTVVFRYFVHPNRWTSFFGQYYFLTKALIQRLEEEARHIAASIKAYQAVSPEPKTTGSTRRYTSGEGQSIQVDSFQVELDLPKNDTKFPEFQTMSISSLDELSKRRNDYLYHVIPKLRFATRATELAFFKHGQGKFPTWLKNCEWESGYSPKGRKTVWDRLVLFQPGVGQTGVGIRKRIVKKSETVSKSYAGRAA